MSEERCPKCGHPMVIGWIGACGMGWLCWREGEKGSIEPSITAERLESLWKLGGLRAYRCKECGLFLVYEKGREPKE